MKTTKNTMKNGHIFLIIRTEFWLLVDPDQEKCNTLYTLLNLINEQENIDKIYLYAKGLSEPKYEYLIRNRENAGIKHVNNSKPFIEYSNTMDDIYENINDYNPCRKRKILIVFDYMIADIMSNKKFQSIIKESFIKCRKLNISLVFITQSYSSVPKDVRLNSTRYLIMKINNKREL